MADIKITVGDAVDASTSGALGQLRSLKLPAKVSYKVGKISKKIYSETQQFFESEMEALRKYGAEEKEAGDLRIDPKKVDDIKAFQKERKELRALKITLTGCIKINLSELGDVEVPVGVMSDMQWAFIDDSEEEEPEPVTPEKNIPTRGKK